MSNFRRSQRHRFQLEVLFKGIHRSTPALTQDVSFHGVFIRTDESRAPNQLLKFTVVHPETGEHLDLLGIVARCVTPAEADPDHPPGIGVSLFGNSRATEAAWVALVRQVKSWAERGLTRLPTAEPAAPLEAEPSSPAGESDAPLVTPPPEPSAPPVDAVRRAHVRRKARFNVTLRPEGIEALAHFEMRDISEGGTFVLTRQLLPIQSRVNLRLVHPNSGETFTIGGTVVRSIDSVDPNEKGIGIRFDRDAVDQAAWDAFIKRNAPRRDVGTPVVPNWKQTPSVRVLRTPHKKEPPVIMGEGEAPPPAVDGPDPGGPPILLGDDEEPVPVILGDGVQPPEPPPLPPHLPPIDDED